MKELVKACSFIVIFLLGIFSLFSLHPLAEENLNDSGNMQWKMERIGQDDVERENLASQDYKETELEKIAPDLFKEQTRAMLETKQIEIKETTKKLEQNLFVTPSKPNTTLNDTKRALFSSNYTVQNNAASNENTAENGQESVVNKKIWIILSGFVLVSFAGIYAMMRKMME